MSRQRYTRRMGTTDDRTDQKAPWRSRRHRMRLECRECEVICERVVHPWHCLKSNCVYVYAYEDGEDLYFGCLWKVFPGEFNMAVFSEASRAPVSEVEGAAAAGLEGNSRLRRRGDSRRRLRTSDPYGAVRIRRPPRPQCRVSIEQAYEAFSTGGRCCNPTFFHHQFGEGSDTIKLTTAGSDDAEQPQT